MMCDKLGVLKGQIALFKFVSIALLFCILSKMMNTYFFDYIFTRRMYCVGVDLQSRWM